MIPVDGYDVFFYNTFPTTLTPEMMSSGLGLATAMMIACSVVLVVGSLMSSVRGVSADFAPARSS